jgi:regulator of RNase E activity RraA
VPPITISTDPDSSSVLETAPEAKIEPSKTKIIAPISTALFIAKGSQSFPDAVPPLAAITQTFATGFSNIPKDTPYADLTTPNTILVVSQPVGQSCAVVGGIMAARMCHLGAKAVVVDGRVRDLRTLRDLSADMPIWTRSTSIIGAGAEAKAWCTNVEVLVGQTSVMPGDIGIIDEEELGVVVIPKEDLEEVLELLPKLVGADERVMEDVLAGGEVGEAFKKYRGK